MLRKILVALAAIGIGLLAYRLAQQPPATPPPLVRQVPSMGTILAFTVHPGGERCRQAVDEAIAEVARLNEVFSFHRETSLVSIVNRAGAQGTRVTEEFLLILERSRRMWSLTDGRFDVTVGPLMKLWGFERRLGKTPSPDSIARALSSVGFEKVVVEGDTVRLTAPGMALDFGAVVMGYAVDRAAAILRSRGIENFMIDLGGDIVVAGAPPGRSAWRIGIRDPRNRNLTVGVIELRDAAVATSGDYERMFEIDGKRYAHIVDPRSGYPVEEMAAVTVITDDGLAADLFSTALFLRGPEPALLGEAGLRGALFGRRRAGAGETIEWSADERFLAHLRAREVEIETIPR